MRQSVVDDQQSPILFLHGFLSGGAAWGPVRRHLADVPTIAPDLPGYGDARRAVRGRYSLDAVLDYLAPLVERERPAHVVGHSMGGIVALGLGVRFPCIFRSVGVVGLPVYRDPADAVAFLRRRGLVTNLMLRDHRLGHGACESMRRLRDLWAPAGAIITPRPRDALTTMFDHTFESHADGLDRIVFAGLVDGLADAVSVPVAALHGRRDRSAPLPRARDLAGRHGWSFKIAPTASHQVIFERPALTARWLREFVLGQQGVHSFPVFQAV